MSQKKPLFAAKTPAGPFAANGDLVLGEAKHHAHLLLDIAKLLINRSTLVF